MNILLTGGAGFIGSHTALALKSAGHNIVIYDNFSNSSQSIIHQLEKVIGEKIDSIKGDIRDTELLCQTLKKYLIKAVIHFAGLKSVGESIENPLDYFDNNVVGTIGLLKAMNQSSVKNLVFSSSANVYGNPQYLPVDESHPLSPTNPYGRTKLQIEQILEDLSFSDPTFKVINLRYFNPVGAHVSGLIGESIKEIPNNLAPIVARVAKNELPMLQVFGNRYNTSDGTGVRDYIHVMDLAEGHVAALDYLSKSIGFETFNLGTGKGYSVLELISSYEKASNKKIPYEIVEERPGDIASSFANADKAKTILNWQAKRSLDEMCLSDWKWQLLLISQPKGH